MSVSKPEDILKVIFGLQLKKWLIKCPLFREYQDWISDFRLE